MVADLRRPPLSFSAATSHRSCVHGGGSEVHHPRSIGRYKVRYHTINQPIYESIYGRTQSFETQRFLAASETGSTRGERMEQAVEGVQRGWTVPRCTPAILAGNKSMEGFDLRGQILTPALRLK